MDKEALHRRSPIPLFLQMVSALRRRIESGIWAPGGKIPSLEELAEEFGVARATARQAITALETEGLIWRKQGKGTFVSENFEDKRWLNVVTNWEDIDRYEKGEAKITKLSSSDNVELPYGPPPRGKPAGSYHYQKKLHSLKGQPYGVINIYLETDIYNKSPEAYDGKSVLYTLYSKRRIKLEAAHQILTIGASDIENAHLLDIAIDAPIVNMRRYVSGEDGTILYFADNIYPAEIVKIEMDVR